MVCTHPAYHPRQPRPRPRTRTRTSVLSEGVLPEPLDETWREALDRIARARGWTTTHDAARLGACVAELSATYNDDAPRSVRASSPAALAARLLFSFPRDVAKGAGAVRELVASGALAGDRPLRVLDIGAGLGAMTWGAARALAAAGGSAAAIDAALVDDDPQALGLAMEIARARGDAAGISVRARAVVAPVDRAAATSPGEHDLVLVGQVLSELDRDRPDGERVARHADLLAHLLDRAVAEHGALVVVEPALRERTRHLHRLRDELAVSGRAHVFAPCLHAAGCPALSAPGDWCHEDLPVDLPPWLVPVARAAGLRWQGLTFSYLVLTRDGRTLASMSPPGAGRVRVVSDRLVTKGKSEVFLCGEHAAGVGRVRATRLDRHAGDENRLWDEVIRGDLMRVSPPLDPARPRVDAASALTRIDVARARR